MIPVLTPADARAWDAAAVAAGRPLRLLMDAAGRAVALAAFDEFGDHLARGVLVAAGAGGNGGDGWVAARVLHVHGVPVWVVDGGEPDPGPARDARAMALHDGVRTLAPDGPWPAAALVVDALLGSGARGAPRDAVAAVIARLNALDVPVLAVDGPSGLDLDTGEDHGALPAHVTVSFGGVSRGALRARSMAGIIKVADVGHPPADPAWPRLVDRAWAVPRRQPFDADFHKGDRGRVVIVGGAPGMTGAVRLAARGAFAAGAGLVHAIVPEASASDIALAEPDVQVLGAAFDDAITPAWLDLLSRADAVVIGPGLGRDRDRARLVRESLAAARTAVLDADALTVLADQPDAIATLAMGRTLVLTPHRGEFRTLFPDLADTATGDPWSAAGRAADDTGATVLLKGVPTVIATTARTTLTVAAGNPGLATGGSGDTLAGVIAALLARGMPGDEAAAVASLALGEAADQAATEHGVRSVRPMHVVAALEAVWRTWAEEPSAVSPYLVELLPPELG